MGNLPSQADMTKHIQEEMKQQGSITKFLLKFVPNRTLVVSIGTTQLIFTYKRLWKKVYFSAVRTEKESDFFPVINTNSNTTN